jgi:zinc protease
MMNSFVRKSRARKSAILILLGCALLFSPLSAQDQDKVRTKYIELDNGLRVYLYEKHTLPLVNLAVAVNVGSKDENEETSGLVHILEHYILFRGTHSRSSDQISGDIRKHGAYFNAHTGHDISLFEMSLSSEYLDFALENQKDILFNLNLTQEELDEEKQVILEEINQVQDDPFKAATSLVYQNLFPDHPYAKPIYGKEEVIKAASAAQLEKFYEQFFVPGNCVLTVVGDFILEDAEEKIKKVFGSLEKKEFASPEFEKAKPLPDNVEIEKEMDVNQAYLIIGLQAPDYNHPEQYAMDLLTEIIGRGINPMLSGPLRGRRELIRSLSMGYGLFKHGGAVLIFLTLDPKNIKFTRNETLKLLRNAKNMNFSIKDYPDASRFEAFDYLESAKNQIKLKSQQLREKGLDIASSFAMHMMLRDEDAQRNFLESIEKTSSSDLRETAGNYFSKGRYVMAAIVPQKKK